MDFYSTHQDIFNILSNDVISSEKKMLFRKGVALNMFTKLTQKRKGGLANADKADKGGRGVGEILTMADKGGMGGSGPPHFCLT